MQFDPPLDEEVYLACALCGRGGVGDAGGPLRGAAVAAQARDVDVDGGRSGRRLHLLLRLLLHSGRHRGAAALDGPLRRAHL